MHAFVAFYFVLFPFRSVLCGFMKTEPPSDSFEGQMSRASPSLMKAQTSFLILHLFNVLLLLVIVRDLVGVTLRRRVADDGGLLLVRKCLLVLVLLLLRRLLLHGEPSVLVGLRLGGGGRRVVAEGEVDELLLAGDGKGLAHRGLRLVLLVSVHLVGLELRLGLWLVGDGLLLLRLLLVHHSGGLLLLHRGISNGHGVRLGHHHWLGLRRRDHHLLGRADGNDSLANHDLLGGRRGDGEAHRLSDWGRHTEAAGVRIAVAHLSVLLRNGARHAEPRDAEAGDIILGGDAVLASDGGAVVHVAASGDAAEAANVGHKHCEAADHVGAGGAALETVVVGGDGTCGANEGLDASGRVLAAIEETGGPHAGAAIGAGELHCLCTVV